MSRPVRARVRHRTGGNRGGLNVEPDPVAVREALNGRPVSLWPLETRAVVRVLTRHGWSAAQIAGHIGCASRTVVRHRSALRTVP